MTWRSVGECSELFLVIFYSLSSFGGRLHKSMVKYVIFIAIIRNNVIIMIEN